MTTCASSHLNDYVHSLSNVLNMCIYPSVLVGDGYSISVTNFGHSILHTPHQPLHLNNVLITLNIGKNLIYARQFFRDNNCTVEFDAFGFSIKDFMTRRVLLQCDSTGYLYPITKPSIITHDFLTIHQLDVKNAFLHGDLSEMVYMHQPLRTHTTYLLLYVDDIVLTASLDTLLQQPIALLHQEFSMIDLGLLNYFLVVSVTRDSLGMFLSQQKYDIEILERAHMVNCNPSRTPIDTKSKLRDDEAEYRGVANDVAETCWLRNLLRELHTPLSFSTLVYCNNVSDVYLSSNPIQHQRTKHIEIDIHFVRDLVATGQVWLLHVPSRYQYANIFTKRLPPALFEEFRASLSVRSPFVSLTLIVISLQSKIFLSLIGFTMAAKNRSFADSTWSISKSIFLMNFPDDTMAKDLWSVCQTYGTVVDVFIPYRRNKAAKRFAFVRFIRVDNIDRVVGNLCTLWIGRVAKQPNVHAVSYANVFNGAHGSLISSSLALVLDDSCLANRDLSRHVMGKVKDFTSIPNLHTILADEGFSGAKLTYFGGTWVMIEFDKVDTKEHLMKHTGVNSWFLVIKEVVDDFVSEDRIVWVDIEGVPLNAWSRETFVTIGKNLESFKIIVKGKVYMVRAKELFTWNPVFMVHKERECTSDVEYLHEPLNNNVNDEEYGDEYASDVNEVPKTIFGANSSSNTHSNGPRDEQQSEDRFSLYDLLNKKKAREINEPSPSLSHPPGFTPKVLEKTEENIIDHGNLYHNVVNDTLEPLDAKVINSSQEVPIEDHNEQVGLGHKTKKEWIKALSTNYKLNFLAIQETKMSRVSHIEVKYIWGNSNYDFVCSDSLGNSGGILCIWEATIFKKDSVKISYNFIAIYGTWLPNNAKILFIVVYAPQQASSKSILLEYISVLLARWNGEAIVMGDFNEVRSSDERRGSCFNPYSARRFDRFISTSGLVDIKLEGYTFMWSHPSASKMSKLDRFLVSDGIFNLFPFITAICLDRHLSDHRPILLREVHLDFGPIPFRFYHSWFDFVGFDDIIQAVWRSFSHSERNGVIGFKKNSKT
nr:RNA-directed DNA polymerase, eukaryota [Tanacetum cinerariifolium]